MDAFLHQMIRSQAIVLNVTNTFQMGVCVLLDHEFAFISPGGSGWHYQRTALICTVHIDNAGPMIWIRAASTCRYSVDMAESILFR